jgi:hypothetical protein
MLVWRLNLAWKSGHPNQCLRLGDDAKTDRTLRARFRESPSYGSPLSVRAKDSAFLRIKVSRREAGAVLPLAPTWLKYFAAAFRTWRGDMGQNWPREMLGVAALSTNPDHRTLFFCRLNLFQCVFCLFSNGLEDCFDEF